ncbi:TspO/MBR family protein [Bacteroides acidifaciens]|uniref:TspO/MBR family protein n=1 Tax=Bacteroides acidifaciens TaxID=85831 RepID=UPI00258B598B|nr:TspO/MBR family protein [Bacteroides acidifaciens]
MRKFLCILFAVLLCFGVGLTASYFQSASIQSWYPGLIKPAITPPNIAFPIAWGIIYLCMGISIGLVSNHPRRQRRPLMIWFAIQLLLNFLWSISFFYFQNPFAGFMNILLLDVSVVIYIIYAWKLYKPSAICFIPYALWLTLATYLNLYIMIYN